MRELIHWIDCHPRTGWYISVVVTLILLLQVADIFVH